jgi:ABC-type multidrug transport system fused ATPase/permease subunit
MNGRSTMESSGSPLASLFSGTNGALLLAGAGFAAAGLKALGGVGAAYGQAAIAGRVGATLRKEVMDRLLSVHHLRRPRQTDHGGHPCEPANSVSPARRVAALTASIREVETGLHAGVLGGARAFAQLVPLLVVLFALAPKLAVAAVLVFLPFGAALGSVRRVWKRAHAAALEENEKLLEAADEVVRHADLWMSYGAEKKAEDNVARLGETTATIASKLEAGAAAMTGANELLGALALLCALFAARAGWLGRSEDGGTMLGFAVVFFLAYRPIRDLTEARLAWLRAKSAFDGIGSISGAPQARVPSPLSGRGAVPRASARHGETGRGEKTRGAEWDLAPLRLDRLVLSRGRGGALSFSLSPGEIAVVLGPTGAGKTTLLRTLLGLEPARSGEVEYAGASIVDAPAGPASRPFAWVPQDAPLLTDTLEANVTLGGPAEARDILATLGAVHLVDALGESRLGAGGRAVSGGERQWICLARAIATRQPVLLLDEPTSGLDPEAQADVLAAIARLRGKRSVLLVTHRPEPLAIADRVVRLGARSLGVEVVAGNEVSPVQPAE